MVQSIEELRCQLIRTDGSNCGDVRLGALDDNSAPVPP